MRARGIAYRRIDAARYAQGLRELVRTHEPARLVDTLIAGAFIEARSCERFARLAPHLDAELAHFYRSLLRSESRHFRDYLAAARKAADGADIGPRIDLFAERERQLIEARRHAVPLPQRPAGGRRVVPGRGGGLSGCPLRVARCSSPRCCSR